LEPRKKIGFGLRRNSNYEEHHRSRRVTEIDADPNDEPLRFKIQGALTGSCVLALEDAWRGACTGPGGHTLLLDLTEVDSVDESGVALLFQMCQSGTRLVASPECRSTIRRRLRSGWHFGSRDHDGGRN
jgi:ABC-type transporter Mla MlaB component